MPADPTPDLATLDALLAAATPGEWRAIEASHYCSKWPEIETENGENVVSAGCMENLAWVVMRPEDAALIAAAVNALPALLREVRIGRAAREVIEAEEKAEAAADAYGLAVFTVPKAMADELWARKCAAVGALNAARARYRALLETKDA